MFIALLKQAGEGCDYTIACGKTYVKLAATDWDSAMEEAKELVRENYTGDRALSDFALLDVAGAKEVDVDAWYAEFEEDERREREAKDATKDRAELERLAKKLGVSLPAKG